MLKVVEIIGSFDRLFNQKSDTNTKYNAQENLIGKTHYVDDATLRFHHARILEACPINDGLFFKLTESVALDMHNTKRGFRVVVFDLYGHMVERRSLEEAFKTKRAAEKDFAQNFKIDPAEYYRERLYELGVIKKKEAEKMIAASQQLHPDFLKAAQAA